MMHHSGDSIVGGRMVVVVIATLVDIRRRLEGDQQ